MVSLFPYLVPMAMKQCNNVNNMAEDGFMEKLKYEVLKVLAFYDIFRYPLTVLEIYKNLGTAAGVGEVCGALSELKAENKIIMESGYFFLPENGNAAEKRKARFLISFKKLERAKRIARVFAWFPFIKFIGVCNSLGYFNAAENSDIDFFIIARSKHIWTARFFSAAVLKFFNLRPTAETGKDKFCLSFFISDGALDISGAALPHGDPYFWHWMNWTLPLYDDKIYEHFVAANGWIKNIFPNFIPQNHYFAKRPSEALCEGGSRPRFIKKIFEKFLGGAEKFLKNIQLKAMPASLKESVNRGDGSVVINDEMLKFHLLDRRAEYRDKFYANIEFVNFKFQIPNSK